MNSRNTPIAIRPANRFRSRASLGSAAAFATAATAAAPSLAKAEIIWSGLLDEEVDSVSLQVLLDLNGNSTPDPEDGKFNYFPPTGKDEDTFPAQVSIGSITSDKSDPVIAFGTAGPGDPVSFGATIDSSLIFASDFGVNSIPNTGIPTYFGFRYQAAGGPFYGWVEASFAPDRSFGTLHQWAYNSTSGAPITVGAVPEPSAMALVGIAAVAFACLRKRIRRA